jgi:hypothetical protein
VYDRKVETYKEVSDEHIAAPETVEVDTVFDVPSSFQGSPYQWAKPFIKGSNSPPKVPRFGNDA